MRGAKRGGEEEGDDGGAGEEARGLPAAKGRRRLRLVAAVGFDVEQIVDDVGGGGAKAEGKKGQGGEQGLAESGRGVPGVGEQQGQEDEGVFGPLVEADGFEPGAQGGGGVDKGLGGSDAGGAEAGCQGAVGVGEHGLAANSEDGKVGAGVADVGELGAEAGVEGGKFVRAGEVVLAV